MASRWGKPRRSVTRTALSFSFRLGFSKLVVAARRTVLQLVHYAPLGKPDPPNYLILPKVREGSLGRRNRHLGTLEGEVLVFLQELCIGKQSNTRAFLQTSSDTIKNRNNTKGFDLHACFFQTSFSAISAAECPVSKTIEIAKLQLIWIRKFLIVVPTTAPMAIFASYPYTFN